MDDEALLDRATSPGRLLFTQDQDFLRIASDRQEAGTPFLGILFAHQQDRMGSIDDSPFLGLSGA